MTTELMNDFGIGAAALGHLSAFYFYSYVAMQIPTGILVDTWGPHRLLTTGACVAGIGSLIFATASSAFWAGIGRLLIGGSVSVAWVGLDSFRCPPATALAQFTDPSDRFRLGLYDYQLRLCQRVGAAGFDRNRFRPGQHGRYHGTDPAAAGCGLGAGSKMDRADPERRADL